MPSFVTRDISSLVSSVMPLLLRNLFPGIKRGVLVVATRDLHLLI
jgi:hypothetical protein